MAVSPRSTVSSDLYSPSEPEQSNAHVHGGSIQIGEHHSAFEDGNAEADGSDYSDTMQGLDSAGEDVSSPSSAAAGPILGVSSETTHKRKREDYVQDEASPEQYRGLKYQEGGPLTPNNESFGATNRSPFQWQDDGTIDDPSRMKRPKPNGKPLVSTKETTLSCKFSALPAAVWQHVFCFVPPVFLGRLLRVNHAFNSYLTTDEKIEDVVPLTHSIIQPLTADAIWVASRRRFAPGLPRPIRGLRELDMWRLLVGRNCQICGHVKDADPATFSENPWEAGPGESGVRIVWPFGVRCCGSCLQDISKKELDLYLSTCPSFLVPAVPFAFVSEGNHYISHNLLKHQTTPHTLQMTKHFYKSGIEDVIRRFEDAKALGTGPAEEWIKGLAGQGHERLEDVIRWEQWESKGGLKRVNSRHHPKPVPSGVVPTSKKPIPIKDETHSERSTPQSTVSSARHDGGHTSAVANLSIDDVHSHSLGAVTAPLQPLQPTWSATIQHLGGTPQSMQNPIHHPRPERNIRDVNEAKAVRRAEIERRCAALNPPLTPSVLSHMESFQAAMQITQPMTDQAWQILKPRLLTQLPYAERKEKERLQQDELLAEEYRQRQQQEVQLKVTKETFDREWETFQNPVRNRLGALAEDFINSKWAGGRSVTKDTSPIFAAEVLLHVRQRFYAEVAQADEAAAAAGEGIKYDPPNGPPTRKLILENMKWLFDTKVKPLTDSFQRELFLCNGCDGNFKFYGFEGVIQHYAAKHTTTLSLGNIVVHWRAEWPEHPPFNPNPSVAKTAYYKVPTPANPTQVTSANDPLGFAPHGGFDQSSETRPVTSPQAQDSSQYPADTSAITYTGLGQERHLSTNSTQSYTPSTTFGGVAGYAGAPNGYVSNAISYNPYATTQQGHASQTYGSSYPVQQPYPAFAQGQLAANPQSYFPGPGGNTYGNGLPQPYQSNFQNGGLAPAVPGPVPDLYQRQMEEMAKHAKEVFIGIGGVKDLPGSVRIHVVIQLTVSRFKTTFRNEPSLSMFIDGLDHNATMRPVRSVNGLGCKTCIQSGTGAKLFTLPHLVNHFRTVHVEGPQMLAYPQAPELDWKVDMIDLPDASIISRLANAAGMTDSKLAIIASVFQGYFPSSLPISRGKTNTGPHPPFRRELDMDSKGPPRALIEATSEVAVQSKDPSGDQLYGQSRSASQQLSQIPMTEPFEPPGEDEYDPHRPALLGNNFKAKSRTSLPDKSGRPPTQQGVRPSSPQVQLDLSQRAILNRMDSEQSYDRAKPPRSQFDKSHSHRSYNRVEHTAFPQSPRSDLMPRSRGQNVIQNDRQTMPQHHDEFTKYEVPTEYGDRYGHTPETGDIGAKPGSVNLEAPNASPNETVNAADQFLSNFLSQSDAGRSYRSCPLDNQIGYRSEVQWQESPQANHQSKHLGGDGAYDYWSANGTDFNGQGDEMSAREIRTSPSDLRNGILNGTLQRSGSRAQYHREYHPSSNTQMPVTATRVEQGSIGRYFPQQGGNHDRQETNGSVIMRPRSGSHTYQVARVSDYGPASRSPHETPSRMALYRPRSPVEEDRGDPMYHARSPPPRRQKDRPEQVLSYEFPQQVRYEYIDDRDLGEVQYQPRFEYVRVPVDYEDSRMREPPARYLLSRPMEQVEPQYVRYEQTYADGRTEPVYERNGQFYHAPQRAFQEQSPRAAPSLT